GRADFVPQLATGGFDRALAVVDAALRHLPGVGLLGAPSDEDPPVSGNQHQADIATVEFGLARRHGRSCAGWARMRAMHALRHSKWPMIGTNEAAGRSGRRLNQARRASIAWSSGCITPKPWRAGCSDAVSPAQATRR